MGHILIMANLKLKVRVMVSLGLGLGLYLGSGRLLLAAAIQGLPLYTDCLLSALGSTACCVDLILNMWIPILRKIARATEHGYGPRTARGTSPRPIQILSSLSEMCHFLLKIDKFFEIFLKFYG